MSAIEWTEEFIAQNPIVDEHSDEAMCSAVNAFLTALRRKTKSRARLTAAQVKSLATEVFSKAFESSFLEISGIALKGMRLVDEGLVTAAEIKTTSYSRALKFRYVFALPTGYWMAVVLEYKTGQPETEFSITSVDSEPRFSWRDVMMADLSNFDLCMTQLIAAVKGFSQCGDSNDNLIRLVDAARNLIFFLGNWPDTKLEVAPGEQALKAKMRRLRSVGQRKSFDEDYCCMCWKLTTAAVNRERQEPLRQANELLLSETRCEDHIGQRAIKAQTDRFKHCLDAVTTMMRANPEYRLRFKSTDDDSVWNFWRTWIAEALTKPTRPDVRAPNVSFIQYRFLAYYMSIRSGEKISARIDIEELKRTSLETLTQAQIATHLGSTARVVQSNLAMSGCVDFDQT